MWNKCRVPLWACLLILFPPQSDEHLHLIMLRWRDSESKWIKGNTMWKSVLCCDRARSAAASHSSRRFCSVTAVVCRQFSHMTWGGETSSLLPVSALFGQDGCCSIVVARAVYESMWSETKTWDVCWSIVLHWHRPQLLRHMLHTGHWVLLQCLSITYICYVK